MTQRWSWILITTLCCLLTLATSAFAECAWVLWSKRVDQADWRIHSSYQTMDDCIKALDSIEGIKPGARTREKPTVLLLTESAAMCVPDTIDPRGPKGK